MRELTTQELLWPNANVTEELNQPLSRILAEGHGRISQALIGLVAALTGFAALMLRGFQSIRISQTGIGSRDSTDRPEVH